MGCCFRRAEDMPAFRAAEVLADLVVPQLEARFAAGTSDLRHHPNSL